MYQKYVRFQERTALVLPRMARRSHKHYEVAKGLIAQHYRQATIWQDECRSVVNRYDSDVSEFRSEQRNAIAEMLQMKTAALTEHEHDAVCASAMISALEKRDFRVEDQSCGSGR